MPERCQYVRGDGSACRALARAGRRFCFWHDDASEGRRREARRAGGRSRSRPRATLPADAPDVVIGSPADVVRLVGETVSQVRRGGLDPRIGNCVGVLLGVALRALQETEVQRLAAELAELKGMIHADRDATAARGAAPAESRRGPAADGEEPGA